MPWHRGQAEIKGGRLHAIKAEDPNANNWTLVLVSTILSLLLKVPIPEMMKKNNVPRLYPIHFWRLGFGDFVCLTSEGRTRGRAQRTGSCLVIQIGTPICFSISSQKTSTWFFAIGKIGLVGSAREAGYSASSEISPARNSRLC
jgi:hypothetical protein